MTARSIRPDELLSLAALLAGEGASRGRPRSVHLRRAVSSAYYAVVHGLVQDAVDELYRGSSGTAHQQVVVGRWIDHGDLRALAGAVGARGTPPAVAAAFAPPSPDLLRFAEGFVALIDARHLADYDHAYDVDKQEALALLQLARNVRRRAAAMLAAGDVSYQIFLRLVLGGLKVAKKR